ncbi:hypothetical protein [Lysobacter claricitrinus]|uniref:hypothetical protein n=1 Tax=Lysobacter claricitrinus TaxID=3367728 RepID=UPI0037DAB19B
MKLHRTLLALAASALFAAPAFASGGATIFNVTDSEDFAVTLGFVDAFGFVDISSKSAAVADQYQQTIFNTSLGDGDHAADLNGDALRNAQGNIGVNVGAGVGNTQSNDAALSSVDAGKVFATAMATSSQTSLLNAGYSADFDTFYSAVLNGNALRNARGNIGVNVAAGVGNAQGNAMTGSVNTSGRYAIATSASDQSSLGNVLEAVYDLDTFAVLGGNALQGAQGNIGVNVAAGVGNLQHNGLSIASAVDGP